MTAIVNNNKLAPTPSLHQIKANIHRRLLETLDLHQAQTMAMMDLQRECSRRIDVLLNEQRIPLSAMERQQLLREVMDDIFGLGPIEALMRDPMTSDVLVNGAHKIYVERQGRLELTNASFRDDAQLIQVIQRIAASVGRRIDEASPMLDARLADGSRVNAIIPPLAIDGPSMSIRRFGTIRLDLDQLIELRTLTREMADFLQACVSAKINIIIAGGTGSGKTTFLNVLSKWIPGTERLVSIEDAAELQLQRDHVVRLESRPANIEGRGEVSQRELLRNTLRMRPDRIIIGEVRGAEALDMLQAMNTGHEGSMTTVHANNSRDAVRRIENMVSMAGLNYPIQAIRQQIASAVDLMVHVARLVGGQRKLVSISEITGMEGDIICMQDLFGYRQTGVDADGNAVGHFEVNGVRPRVMDRLIAAGHELSADLFRRRVLEAK